MDQKISLQTPKVTVLMPVYNCAEYVSEAIESILSQTFKDFEFLIIDDASTDNTVSIIKSYSDSRINLIEKPENTGYTNSLNYGLSIAKGEYIARMDGDDISFPKRFAKQVRFMDANPEVVVCGTNYQILGTDIIKNVPITHEDIKVALLYGSCIGHPTVIMRKSILNKYNINYDSNTEPAEDYNLWIRLLKFGKLHNLPEVLLHYRVHPKQVSREKGVSQQQSGVDSKFILLNYLNINYDLDEQEVFKKIISRKVEIQLLEFHEIILFLSKTMNKLILSNSTGFFNKNGFNKYLNYLKDIIIKDYFLYRQQFEPAIFNQYVIIKKKYNYKFPFFKELKLLFKCIIYYKNKRSIKK